MLFYYTLFLLLKGKWTSSMQKLLGPIYHNNTTIPGNRKDSFTLFWKSKFFKLVLALHGLTVEYGEN